MEVQNTKPQPRASVAARFRPSTHSKIGIKKQGFLKDYEVWNAGLQRIMEPFSLKSGLELVDAFGSLFDLWTER